MNSDNWLISKENKAIWRSNVISFIFSFTIFENIREKLMGITLADCEKEGLYWHELRRSYTRFCKESVSPMRM